MPIDPSHEQAIRRRIAAIPIVETLGMVFDEFGPGYCRGRAGRDVRYDGVFESFHGGLLMTVADSIACFAVMTQVPAGERLTTTDMNIRFLAACLTEVRAEARVIKLGRTLCPVAVDLFDAAGVKVAVAQVTYMRLGGGEGGQKKAEG